jgi:hypothetical protein
MIADEIPGDPEIEHSIRVQVDGLVREFVCSGDSGGK